MKSAFLALLMLVAGFLTAQDMPRMVGHRGCGKDAPENTLSALRAGIVAGMQCLEVDVHLSRDKEVVLSHDETLDRCTNGKGRLDEHTWAELQTLDAGAWYSDHYKGERMPSLAQALDVVRGQATLFIEIKGTGNDYEGLEKRVVELIQQSQSHAWVEVISFNTHALRRVHALDSRIRLQQLLVSNLRALPFYLDKSLHWGSPKRIDFVQGFSYFHRCTGPGMVRKIHRWGKQINAWTVVKPVRMARLRKIGIDAITTDAPATLKQVLSK